MSGMVDRRNDRGWWTGSISWSRVKTRANPPCDDCVINAYASGGTDKRIPRAKHRRKNGRNTQTFGMDVAFRSTVLCDIHKQEWLDWTPGQQVLS